jgi:hypothetical protein
VKPTHFFCAVALTFAALGYFFLIMGENRGYYGVCGIFGTLFAIIALINAFKNAGWLGDGFIGDE